MQSIKVRHNVEMGHRLSQQPDSKCFHLHGHSWWIDLEIIGAVSSLGMVGNLNFGNVKQIWRAYLDQNFDHHMCLSHQDPLVHMIKRDIGARSPGWQHRCEEWGIRLIDRDPTVENMALIWGEAAWEMFVKPFDLVEGVAIEVQEAATNKATWYRFEEGVRYVVVERDDSDPE